MTDAPAIMNKMANVDGVEQLFPRVQFYAMLGNNNISVAGRGIGIVGAKEQNFFNRINIVKGEALGENEEGIVLGKGLAHSLGVDIGDRVTVLGQTVHGSVNALDLVVQGIFHIGFKEADDALFQVQLSQAHILLDTQKVETISIGLRDDADWHQVAASLKAVLPHLEAVDVNVLDEVWAKNGENFLQSLLNIFRLVFLGVILLAIFNSASNTVLERRQEIGMLRANGESGWDVVRLFFLEGTFQALIGATLGILLLFAVMSLLPEGLPMPPTPGTSRELPVGLDIQWNYVVSCFLLGSLVAMVSVMGASIQVLRLSISDALKQAS